MNGSNKKMTIERHIVTEEKMKLIKKIMKDEHMLSLLLLSLIRRTDGDYGDLLNTFREMEKLGVL